jgi:hemerythrin superfamily protein
VHRFSVDRFVPSRSVGQETIVATTSQKSSLAKSAPKAKTATRARPKTGSRTTRQSSASARKSADAIALLKADHKEVDAMFKAYEKTDDDAKKQELADNICMALTVHAQIEEEIFYPAAYEALDEDGDDLLDEAEVEHASCKALIAEIEAMSVGEPLFDAKVKVLGEYIKHHVEEEETELFPECRDAKMDLKALGEQLAMRKQELMAA